MRTQRKGGITGKGFVEGDPRINRTIPGPGRPPNWWRDLLSHHEEDAIKILAQALRYGSWASRRQAAEAILDRLHGKPTQPVEQRSDIEPLVQYMTAEELRELVRIVEQAQARAAKGEKPQEWPSRLDLESD